MFMTNDQFTELYGIEYTGEPFVLCRKCFNETYATFYGSHGIPCSSCGAKPKKGTAFSRHSPDAEKVSQHLSKQTGQNIIINPDDYLCSTCYKIHSSIIESLKSPNGRDAMLKEVIDQWITKYNSKNTDKLTKAILETVICVANHLLLQKAVLLPWACNVFLQSYEQSAVSCTSTKVTIETGDSSVMFTSKWLLYQLIKYLNSYMLYKCVHKKFGTILYCKGIDVLVSLSWAPSSQSLPQDSPHDEHTCGDATKLTDNKAVLHNAACIVNDLIYEEIERQSITRSQCYANPSSFSIDNKLKHVNQLLLGFIDSITSTIREQKHLTSTKKARLAST